MIRRKSGNVRGQHVKAKDKPAGGLQEQRSTEDRISNDDHVVHNKPSYYAQEKSRGNSVTEPVVIPKRETVVEPKREERIEGKQDEKDQLNARRKDGSIEGSINRPVYHQHNKKNHYYNNKMNMNRADSNTTVGKGPQPAQERPQYQGSYKNGYDRRRMVMEADEEEDAVRTILRLHRTRFREFKEMYNEYCAQRNREEIKKVLPAQTRQPSPQERQIIQEQLEAAYKREFGTVKGASRDVGSTIGMNAGGVSPVEKIKAAIRGEKMQSPRVPSANPVTPVAEQQSAGNNHVVVTAENRTEKPDEQGEFNRNYRRQEGGKQQLFDRRKKRYNGKFNGESEEQRSVNNNGRFRNRYQQKRDFKKDRTPTVA